MLFAVSKYQDVIMQKREKEFFGGQPCYLYFDDENEARAFLQDRAFRNVQVCEKALVRAKAKLAKCRKKFPVTLTHR